MGSPKDTYQLSIQSLRMPVSLSFPSSMFPITTPCSSHAANKPKVIALFDEVESSVSSSVHTHHPCARPYSLASISTATKLTPPFQDIAVYRLGNKHFALTSHLIRGGFGKFRLGCDATGALLGIKVVNIKAKAGTTEDDKPVRIMSKEQLLSEINIQNTYSVANQIQYVGQYRHKWMMIMPAFAGSLFHWMNRSAWQDASATWQSHMARAITVHVGQQLHTMHQDHWLHRDIKPENILVDQRLGIELADFGLARKSSPRQKSAGTFAYMAPELYADAQASCSKASDLWSLGLTILSILSHSVPILKPANISQQDPSPARLFLAYGQKMALLTRYLTEIRVHNHLSWPQAPQAWQSMFKQAYKTDGRLTDWLLHGWLHPQPDKRGQAGNIPSWLRIAVMQQPPIFELLQQCSIQSQDVQELGQGSWWARQQQAEVELTPWIYPLQQLDRPAPPTRLRLLSERA